MANTSSNRITLTNLRPFSYYNVSVKVYTRYGHGNQTSDTLYLLSGEDGAFLDTNTLIATYSKLKLKYQQGHLVSFLQFQAVLHMASVSSLSVPARWMWPGSLLSFLTGSSFTTAWSFGILLTTWILHHRQTTSTSHIWGSTRTTESWCKLTHASALETTAVSHSTSLRWRMVRRMIEGKGERAGFPFIFSRSSRQEFDDIRLFLSSFLPHYGSAYQLIMLHSQVLWCHISLQDCRLQSSWIIMVFMSRSVSSSRIFISRGSNLSCENTHFYNSISNGCTAIVCAVFHHISSRHTSSVPTCQEVIRLWGGVVMATTTWSQFRHTLLHC